jgi:hypothetical protein
MHIFWIIGLLLAMIDLPDFVTPLRRMAGSLESMAGMKPGQGDVDLPDDKAPGHAHAEGTAEEPDKRPLTLAKTGS